jgi:biotin carboxylase
MTEELWALFVCAGRWQLDAMLQAKQMGYKIVAIDSDKNAEGFKVADKHFVIDINDTEKIIEIIEYHKIILGGVICIVSDTGQKPAARIREKFDLFGMSVFVATNMTNKEVQRTALKGKKGINIPKFLIFQEDISVEKIEKKIGYPCVVKPVDSAGSRGVAVVSRRENLTASIQEAVSYSSNGRIIIEEYIEGKEYTIETFTHDYKTDLLLVTEKGKIRDTLANELFSSNLLKTELNILHKFINKVFKILEYNFGPGHTEVIKRNSDGKFFLVESAGRGGGFMLSDLLVPLASGFNINQACVTQAMGRMPKMVNDSSVKNKVLLRFIPSKKGKIKSLKGFDQGAKMDNVETGCFLKVGDFTEDAKVDSNRVGFIAAKDKSMSNLFSIVEHVEKNIKVEYYDN